MTQTPPPSGGSPDPDQPTPQPGGHGQPPYGGPPYGGPPYPQYPYGAPPADHPQATMVLVLGILGVVSCGLIAPFAWVIGNRVVNEIDAGNGTIGGRGNAHAGRICGIVGTILLAINLLLLAVVFVFGGFLTVISGA